MKSIRITRLPDTRRPALLGAALVLLAVTSSSVAAADDGPGPFGVTVRAAENSRSVRVGALFHGGAASGGAGGHFCTASVVRSRGRDLVLTAAHCLEGETQLSFAPGYRDGRAPYGFWDVQGVFLPEGWRRDQDEDSDVAFAVLATRDGKEVEDVVGGGNPFAAHRATGATAVTVTGYPGSVDSPVTCTDKPTAYGRTQQRVECPAFAGGPAAAPG